MISLYQVYQSKDNSVTKRKRQETAKMRKTYMDADNYYPNSELFQAYEGRSGSLKKVQANEESQKKHEETVKVKQADYPAFTINKKLQSENSETLQSLKTSIGSNMNIATQRNVRKNSAENNPSQFAKRKISAHTPNHKQNTANEILNCGVQAGREDILDHEGENPQIIVRSSTPKSSENPYSKQNDVSHVFRNWYSPTKSPIRHIKYKDVKIYNKSAKEMRTQNSDTLNVLLSSGNLFNNFFGSNRKQDNSYCQQDFNQTHIEEPIITEFEKDEAVKQDAQQQVINNSYDSNTGNQMTAISDLQITNRNQNSNLTNLQDPNFSHLLQNSGQLFSSARKRTDSLNLNNSSRVTIKENPLYYVSEEIHSPANQSKSYIKRVAKNMKCTLNNNELDIKRRSYSFIGKERDVDYEREWLQNPYKNVNNISQISATSLTACKSFNNISYLHLNEGEQQTKLKQASVARIGMYQDFAVNQSMAIGDPDVSQYRYCEVNKSHNLSFLNEQEDQIKETLNSKCPHLVRAMYCNICNRKIKSQLISYKRQFQF